MYMFVYVYVYKILFNTLLCRWRKKKNKIEKTCSAKNSIYYMLHISVMTDFFLIK